MACTSCRATCPRRARSATSSIAAQTAGRDRLRRHALVSGRDEQAAYTPRVQVLKEYGGNYVHQRLERRRHGPHGEGGGSAGRRQQHVVWTLLPRLLHEQHARRRAATRSTAPTCRCRSCRSRRPTPTPPSQAYLDAIGDGERRVVGRPGLAGRHRLPAGGQPDRRRPRPERDHPGQPARSTRPRSTTSPPTAGREPRASAASPPATCCCRSRTASSCGCGPRSAARWTATPGNLDRGHRRARCPRPTSSADGHRHAPAATSRWPLPGSCLIDSSIICVPRTGPSDCPRRAEGSPGDRTDLGSWGMHEEVSFVVGVSGGGSGSRDRLRPRRRLGSDDTTAAPATTAARHHGRPATTTTAAATATTARPGAPAPPRRRARRRPPPPATDGAGRRRQEGHALTAADIEEQCASEPLEATEVGVCDSEITIEVLADVGSPLAPGLFQGNIDARQGVRRLHQRQRRHRLPPARRQDVGQQARPERVEERPDRRLHQLGGDGRQQLVVQPGHHADDRLRRQGRRGDGPARHRRARQRRQRGLRRDDVHDPGAAEDCPSSPGPRGRSTS